MALNITVQDTTDRPLVGGGKADTETIDEVRPLVRDVMQLPANLAQPLVVPAGEANQLVNALRAAGELEGVTIRFKRFPRLAEDGTQVTRTTKEGGTVKLFDSFELTGRNKKDARVTFWTTKKVTRPRKPQNAETSQASAD